MFCLIFYNTSPLPCRIYLGLANTWTVQIFWGLRNLRITATLFLNSKAVVIIQYVRPYSKGNFFPVSSTSSLLQLSIFFLSCLYVSYCICFCCLPVCIFVFLSFYLFAFLSVCLSICLHPFLSIYRCFMDSLFLFQAVYLYHNIRWLHTVQFLYIFSKKSNR